MDINRYLITETKEKQYKDIKWGDYVWFNNKWLRVWDIIDSQSSIELALGVNKHNVSRKVYVRGKPTDKIKTK